MVLRGGKRDSQDIETLLNSIKVDSHVSWLRLILLAALKGRGISTRERHNSEEKKSPLRSFSLLLNIYTNLHHGVISRLLVCMPPNQEHGTSILKKEVCVQYYCKPQCLICCDKKFVMLETLQSHMTAPVNKQRFKRNRSPIGYIVTSYEIVICRLSQTVTI